MLKWLERQVLDIHVVYRANDFNLKRAAVRAGIGIAALGCSECDPDPELVRLLSPIDEAAHELWVVTHRDLRHTARIRAVLDYFYEAFRADRDLFEGRYLG